MSVCLCDGCHLCCISRAVVQTFSLILQERCGLKVYWDTFRWLSVESVLVFALILSCIFQVDEFYVGVPPPREVTFVNLNDNINSDFLRKMVQDLGRIDECSVCYNPQNGKHLGIAKVGCCTNNV